MFLRPATTIIAAILSGLLMTGCVTQDDGKAIPDASAFEWAMNQDIRFKTVIDECGKVDSELAKKFPQLRAQWEKQYWSAINAANDAYNNQQAAKIYTYNGEKISLPAAKFMIERKEAALRELYYQKRISTKQAEYCQLRIAAYEKKEDGLGKPLDANKLRYLNEIAAKAPMMAPRSVPSLAGSLQPSAPGPALYGLEQEARTQKCNSPKIMTFYNEGHDELYGVYCVGSAGYFVGCAWSQCSSLK